MKKNILLILAGIIIFGNSCSKDFLTVNEVNPNNPSKVPASLVLPGALRNVAFTMNYPRRFDFVYLWHGLWSISAGYSQPQNLVQYKLLNSNYQEIFIELYTAANNLDAIEKSSTDPKDVYYLATAKIMKAYIFQNLVDLWGDVPYSEAFKTADGNLKPKYDKQQDIYEDLVVQLDAAMNLIVTAPVLVNAIPASSDIMYAGDMSKWAKFANTVKLRILVHQSSIAGRADYISDKIATTASIGYLGAGDGALVNPGYSASWTSATDNKENPFYGYFYNASATSNSDGITYYFAGKNAVDFMKSTNDPRLEKFFNPFSGTSFDGNYFGQLPADLTPQNKTSKLGYVEGDPYTMIGTPSKSAPILTDFESLFIQAEAAQRGFITGDAAALYNAAVASSFVYMGSSASAAAAYVAQPNPKINFANGSDKLGIILTQKWISLNGIAPAEIWTDYRRSGYPTGLTFSVDPARESDTPPIRLLYPQDELNVNNANVLAVGKIDAFTSKIFWQTR